MIIIIILMYLMQIVVIRDILHLLAPHIYY